MPQSTIGFPQGYIYSKNGEPPRKVANELQILEPTTSTFISEQVSNLPKNAAWDVNNLNKDTSNSCSDSTETELLKNPLQECKIETIEVKEELQEFDPVSNCSVDPCSNSVAAASITKEHEINEDVKIKTELDHLHEDKFNGLPRPDYHHCFRDPAQNVSENPSALATSKHMSSPSEWSNKTVSGGLQDFDGESTDTASETGEEEKSYVAPLISTDEVGNLDLYTKISVRYFNSHIDLNFLCQWFSYYTQKPATIYMD